MNKKKQFFYEVLCKKLSRIMPLHPAAIVRHPSDPQIVNVTSQGLAIIPLDPVSSSAQTLLPLALSTLRPAACLPVSLYVPSQVHCLTFPLSPDLSFLECPGALDTHGEPATRGHLLPFLLVLSPHPLSLATDSPPPPFPSHRPASMHRAP